MILNINANLTISVKGLAICHYNASSNVWEFLMPREVGDHKLKIIFTTYFKDGRTTICEIPVSESIAKIAVETNDKIELSSEVEFNFINRPNFDERDACWILDIKELYGKAVKLENIKNKKYTYLAIPAGTLYATKFPENPLVRIAGPNGASKTTRVAQAAGVDIQWQAGKGKTTIVNSENGANLLGDIVRDDAVAYFTVEFDNDCDRTCAGEETDYKHYNTDLIGESGKFTIHSIRSLSDDNKSVSAINDFWRTLFENFDSWKCRDAPCFLGECSELDGINSLAELLKQ